MPNNKYVNKVVIGKETKLDLTADTVTPDKLAKGITAHDKSGTPITGTSTKDADTGDATAAVAEVLTGKTFYARRQNDRHNAEQWRGTRRDCHRCWEVYNSHGLP